MLKNKTEDTKNCSLCGQPCPIIEIPPDPDCVDVAESVRIWCCAKCDFLTPRESSEEDDEE